MKIKEIDEIVKKKKDETGQNGKEKGCRTKSKDQGKREIKSITTEN